MMSNLKHIVYKITNLTNKMYYIGKHSTTTPYDMKSYWGSSEYLDNARKKYGEENFKREVLFVFDTEDEAFQKEAELMSDDLVNSKEVYNLRKGGKGGFVCSEETRKKLSVLNMKENHPMWGKHLSEEHKKKIGEGNEGNYHTEESKVKMSIKRGITPEIMKQRLLDIENEPKIRGWKSRLGRKWKINKVSVGKFIEKYSPEFVKPVLFASRILDIQTEPKNIGWINNLSKKWEITQPAVSQFIKRYAPEFTRGNINV